MRRWETADIAILVFVDRRETLIGKKIGLLQSKRLYPDNNDVEDDEDEFNVAWGMNRFIRREGKQAIGPLHSQFSFSEDSIYGAMRAGSHQVQAIDTLNRDFGKAVYYLLYNPHGIPVSISYPLRERIRLDPPAIGCRVLDADHVHHIARTGVPDDAYAPSDLRKLAICLSLRPAATHRSVPVAAATGWQSSPSGHPPWLPYRGIKSS